MSHHHKYFSMYVLQTRTLSYITIIQTSKSENRHWYIDTLQSLDPIHVLSIVPTLSFIVKGAHIVFNCHVSLVTFSLQHFFSPWLSLLWHFWRSHASYFVECLVLLAIFFILIFRLCIFGRNITEVSLCSCYLILSDGKQFRFVSSYWWSAL